MSRSRTAGAASARLHRSVDVPQADRLPNVRRLVAAAHEGIFNAAALLELLGVDDRHFAYYRQAAEILGVVARTRDGRLQVTPRGSELLATKEGSEKERQVFREAMLGARALRPFSSYFKGETLTVSEIASRLQTMTGLSHSTAERRAKTLVQWKRYVLPVARRGSEPIPAVAPQLEAAVASHNALAKQQYLEWLRTIPPATFEELVADLSRAMGYREVTLTGRSGDGGVDVEAVRIDEWGSPRRIVIQVKRYDKALNRKFIDELLGVMTRRRASDGILITCSDFSPKALETAKDVHQVQLVNGVQLVQLLAKHGVGLRLGRYGEILVTPVGEEPPT